MKLQSCHIYSEDLGCSHAGSLVCCFRLCELPLTNLVVFVGFLRVFVDVSDPSPMVLQTLFPLVSRTFPIQPNVWLWFSESASMNHWMKALWWKLGLGSHQSNHRKASSGCATTAARSLSWGCPCSLFPLHQASSKYLKISISSNVFQHSLPLCIPSSSQGISSKSRQGIRDSPCSHCKSPTRPGYTAVAYVQRL